MSAWPRRACVASKPRISFGSGFAAGAAFTGAAPAGVDDVVAGGVAAGTDVAAAFGSDESSATKMYARGPATASTSTGTATYGAADRTRPGRRDFSVGACPTRASITASRLVPPGAESGPPASQ